MVPSPETTSLAPPGTTETTAAPPEAQPEVGRDVPAPETGATPFGPEPRPEPEPLPRAQPGELAAAGCALLLLVLMFTVEWFGVDRLPGQANGLQRETAENAWTAMTQLRWLMLVTIVVAVGAVVLHATQRGHGARNNTGAIVFGLGGVTTLVLIYRVLIDLPSANQVVDQKLGAMLGLLAAAGIALAGFRAMYEERSRAREHPSKRKSSRVARRARQR